MSLPHEILDEILGYLPSEGRKNRRSLRNYSLVAKSWTNPCRRLLFKTVEIREADLRPWLDAIPPANCELLQHVRSLSYLTRTRGKEGDYRIHVLRNYLPSFNRLQHLTLSHMTMLSGISRQVEMFSSFRHTLLRLSLEHCNVTIGALVTLINYFSSLDRLDLSYVLRKVDDEAVPSLARPLVRELHVPVSYSCTFGQLSRFGPVFDEVVVDGRPWVYVHTLSDIVDTLGVKAKRVGLLQRFKRYKPGDGSTLLSRCRNLQELELAVKYPGIEGRDVLSSITSTCLQKVSFIHRYTTGSPSWRKINWEIFNEPLCRLADRLGCTHKLEVDIRIEGESPTRSGEKNGMMIAESLARFREKGQIRVLWVDVEGNKSVIYPFLPPL